MFLNVTTVNGDAIDPKMYNGEAALVGGTPNSVKQEGPNETAWEQWRRLMHMIVHSQWNLKLRTPLDRWLILWDDLRRRWPFLYDATNDKLLCHTPLGYTQHEKITIDYNSTPNQDIIDPVIPETAVPVDVVDRKMTFTIRKGYWQSAVAQKKAGDPVEAVIDLLATVDWWESRLLFDLEL
jgi:hypothetical protein